TVGDKTVALEPVERLAQWRAADLQPIGKRAFRQPAPGLQLSNQDHRLERAIDLFLEGPAACCLPLNFIDAAVHHSGYPSQKFPCSDRDVVSVPARGRPIGAALVYKSA